MQTAHKPAEVVKAIVIIGAVGAMFILVLHNITAMLP